jgi:hypothetical protein
MRRTGIFILTLFLTASLASCFDETVKPIKEPPVIEWPGLTSEDALVEALIWCYSHPAHEQAMERYESLLHSRYFFMLAEDDLAPGEDPVIDRASDLTITGRIFSGCTQLELSFERGSWYDEPEIGGEPCDGCRTMTTGYFIRAQFGADGTIYSTRWSPAAVTIIAAPNEADPGQWAIRAIYDHGL